MLYDNPYLFCFITIHGIVAKFHSGCAFLLVLLHQLVNIDLTDNLVDLLLLLVYVSAYITDGKPAVRNRSNSLFSRWIMQYFALDQY